MDRRNFIKTAGVLSVLYGLNGCEATDKTHILTFSFDDGFKKSFYKAADIHERYGLSACFNVIASAHFPDFEAVGDYILPELMGDFNDWNKLQDRGHEVMPHTWEHLNLTKVPLSKAKENIDKCLAYFEENLDGYTNDGAIYNFAYNASTRELEDFILQKGLTARTGGWHLLGDRMTNDIPINTEPIRIGCWAEGPGLCDDYLEKEINTFLSGSGGWLILNLHGFDDEGWGPVSTEYFDRLLKRLVKLDYLAVLPTGKVLLRS